MKVSVSTGRGPVHNFQYAKYNDAAISEIGLLVRAALRSKKIDMIYAETLINRIEKAQSVSDFGITVLFTAPIRSRKTRSLVSS